MSLLEQDSAHHADRALRPASGPNPSCDCSAQAEYTTEAVRGPPYATT